MVQLRSTIFARDLVRSEEGFTVARVIAKQNSSEIKCWMQAMTRTYPVASYLHRIGRAASGQSLFCNSGEDKTLSHFLSACPRFHDARTAAHNQIRTQLSVSQGHCPFANLSSEVGDCMRRLQCLQLACGCVESVQFKSKFG